MFRNRMSIRHLLLSLLFATVSFHCSQAPPRIVVPQGAMAGELTRETDSLVVDAQSYRIVEGILVVPENREKGNSRLIALPYKRFCSLSPVPAEPVFFLGGGPGEPNIHTEIARWAQDVLPSRDLIMLGYRGVEGSVILDCPEVSQAMKGAGDDLLGSESLSALAKAMSSASQRLEAEGVDLEGYTIEQVAEDIESVRSALSYDKIHLLSMSYGTRVAQAYAALYPEHLKRSVMVGVNPPGHFTWNPDRVDEQIRYYSNLWAADSEAVERSANLEETIRRVAHNMPKRWLFTRIDPGKVRVITFAMLFHTGSAALVFDAYTAADRGDPSGLALMSLAYDYMMPGMMTWGEFFSKGGTDFDSTRNYVFDLDPPSSILGSPMSLLIWGPASVSGAWPIVLLPDSLRQARRSDVETLLISGSIDFSTPVRNAEELLPYLTKGKSVVLAEMGHCADLVGLQPAAFSRLLTSYLDTGNPDTSLFKHHSVHFAVGFGFPAMAKAGLAAIVVVVAAIGGILWFVVRWWRRRKSSKKQS